MKEVVAAFNQEKALVGAFSVIDYEPSDGPSWSTSPSSGDWTQPVRQQLYTKLITDSDGLSPQFWHGKKAFLNDNLLKEHTGILRTMLGIDSWKLNTFLGVKGPMDKISCLSIQIQSALIFGFRVYHYCLNKSLLGQEVLSWLSPMLCVVQASFYVLEDTKLCYKFNRTLFEFWAFLMIPETIANHAPLSVLGRVNLE